MGETDGDWLSYPQQQSWRAYIMGSQLLLDRLDRDLRAAHKLSMAEYEILVRLSEAPHRRMRMAVLAQALCHSRSRITHTVTRMEDAGLIQRSSALEDGRGVVAAMTEAGVQRLIEAAPTHVAGVRKYLIGVGTDEETAAMGSLFDKVSDQLLQGRPEEADIRDHEPDS